MVYEISDTAIRIPFYYTKSNNGDPLTGENLRVKIFDLDNDTIVINNATMNESNVIGGLYQYNWNHGLSVKGQFLAVVELNTSGSSWPVQGSIQFKISDTEKLITENIDAGEGSIC